MSKNRNSLLIFAGLFGILLLMVILQGGGSTAPEPTPQAVDTDNRVFPEMDKGDIAAFSLLDPDAQASLTLQREGADWRLAEFDELVDPQAAEPMALTVSILPYLQVLGNVPEAEYVDYGLVAETGLLISLVMQDETQHAIIIGNSTTDGRGHYALIDDRPEVYVLDARPIAFLVQYLRQIYLPPTATPTATPTITPTPEA